MSDPEVSDKTWRAWVMQGWPLPKDDDLILRSDVLDRVRSHGHVVTVRRLQLWENRGVIPLPIRRWHDGAVRALYAPWVVDMICDLCRWRKKPKGAKTPRRLVEIGDYLRSQVYRDLSPANVEGMRADYV